MHGADGGGHVVAERDHRIGEPGHLRDPQHGLHRGGRRERPAQAVDVPRRQAALAEHGLAGLGDVARLAPVGVAGLKPGRGGAGDRHPVLHGVACGDHAAPSPSCSVRRNTGMGAPPRVIQSSSTRRPIWISVVRRSDDRAGEPQPGLLVEVDGHDGIGRRVIDALGGGALMQEDGHEDRARAGHRLRFDAIRQAGRADRLRRRVPCPAVGAAVDQQLPPQPPSVVGGAVPVDGAGEERAQLLVADVLACVSHSHHPIMIELILLFRRRVASTGTDSGCGHGWSASGGLRLHGQVAAGAAVGRSVSRVARGRFAVGARPSRRSAGTCPRR